MTRTPPKLALKHRLPCSDVKNYCLTCKVKTLMSLLLYTAYNSNCYNCCILTTVVNNIVWCFLQRAYNNIMTFLLSFDKLFIETIWLY